MTAKEEYQELECAGCPLCGEYRAQSTRYGSGDMAVVRCRSCRLWYLSPRLTEGAIAQWYRDAAYFEGGKTGYSSYSKQELSLRATFRVLLSALARRSATGGSLLDVGCGYGFLLAEAEGHFTFRAGTEMSPAAAVKASARAEEIYVGGVEAIPAGRVFDLITALHVIEHVYRPREFVQRVRSHLSPDGALLLATPDMGSYWRRMTGRRWPSFKYPEHVVFYDTTTLKRLLRYSGPVTRLERVPYPHAFPVADVFGKLGFRLRGPLGRCTVWVPATTVALLARFEEPRGI